MRIETLQVFRCIDSIVFNCNYNYIYNQKNGVGFEVFESVLFDSIDYCFAIDTY